MKLENLQDLIMADNNVLDSILGDLKLFDENDIDETNVDFSTILSCSMKYILNNLILNSITNKVSYEDFINDNKQNYLSLLNKKIEFMINKSEEETQNEIRTAYSEVLFTILEKLEETFGFSFDENTGVAKESLSYGDLVQYTLALYDFLVMKRYNNVVEYLYRTIFYDRKSLSEELKNNIDNKKNFSFITLKKVFKINDALVVYFIREIVEELIKMDVKFSEFIENIDIEDSGEISTAIAKKIIFEDNTNIVSETFGIMDDIDLKSSIISEIRKFTGFDYGG